MPLSVLFMGTPAFAVPALSSIVAQGHRVCAVYTQPPRPAGRRGLGETKSPIHRCAEALELEIRTPEDLRDAASYEALTGWQADVAVVVAYGLRLPKVVLEATRLGCLNAHASLLPRWRGAAPIQRAIMAGDRKTGVTIMKMDEGLDTGPTGLRVEVSIGSDMTSGALHDQLSVEAAKLLVQALAGLENETLSFHPQKETGAIYASKIRKSETRIDWHRDSSSVHDHIRGLSPVPGAWCEMEIGGRIERIKVLRSERANGAGVPGNLLNDQLTVACANGAVRLVELQKAGGRRMVVEDFLRGSAVTRVCL